MLRKFAKGVRHLPGLERQEWLWDLIRAPYHKLISIGGAGAKVSIGTAVNARVPAEYSGLAWETYEPETIHTLVAWARSHPGGLFLDVGCEVGIFSLAALSAERSTSVIAFDADLASLAVTPKVCRYTSGNRLQVVWGCLADAASDSIDIDAACAQTQATLAKTKLTGALGSTRFVTLMSEQAGNVPKHTLDNLLADNVSGRPVMLKCDVEGAELLVLQGASRLIAKARPELLLSIHPHMLGQFGHSVAHIADFLNRAGYGWDVIAIDHEEHWFARASHNL